MNYTKKKKVKKWIKNFLGALVIIAAIIIAMEYLTSIQLLWVAIIIVGLFLGHDINKLRSEVFSIRDNLGDWKIFRSIVDTPEDIELYNFRNISVKEIFAKEVISRKMEIGHLGLPSVKIINCSGLSYIVFYGEDGAERFLISIEELTDLLVYVKHKNKYTDEEINEAQKQITSEEEYISKAIAIREELLKEYREEKDEDSEIKEIEKEISELKGLLK
jgi:hypothetical protein